ncbi:MAG: hypothetical protein U0169_04810 [Polyangiaceae bacterium]
MPRYEKPCACDDASLLDVDAAVAAAATANDNGAKGFATPFPLPARRHLHHGSLPRGDAEGQSPCGACGSMAPWLST